MTNLKNKNSIAAVIPFFNECKTINQIIHGTLKYVDCVIIVDDGSTDDYYDKIPNIDNVILLKYDVNRGKGFALSEGLKLGVEKGFEKLITIDADLQHNPDEIPILLSGLNEFDIIIGNRLGNLNDMPFQRILSNKITSFLLSLKTGQKIVDSQCGFRAYNSNVINAVKTTYSGYEAESEMIIRSSRIGFKIAFVDISTIYGNEKSKMNPVKVIFGFIKILFI